MADDRRYENNELSEDELQGRRGALESKGAIEFEDADTDRLDPESQHEQLMASAEAMGRIECPCGWAGDAIEARIVGRGSPLELKCPDCDRLLFVLTIDE